MVTSIRISGTWMMLDILTPGQIPPDIGCRAADRMKMTERNSRNKQQKQDSLGFVDEPT
jgi:hypothetical protein